MKGKIQNQKSTRANTNHESGPFERFSLPRRIISEESPVGANFSCSPLEVGETPGTAPSFSSVTCDDYNRP